MPGPGHTGLTQLQPPGAYEKRPQGVCSTHARWLQRWAHTSLHLVIGGSRRGTSRCFEPTGILPPPLLWNRYLLQIFIAPQDGDAEPPAFACGQVTRSLVPLCNMISRLCGTLAPSAAAAGSGLGVLLPHRRRDLSFLCFLLFFLEPMLWVLAVPHDERSSRAFVSSTSVLAAAGGYIPS